MDMVRDVLWWMMMLFVPASLMAADAGGAMVRPYGTAWLNGAALEQSSAIFPGDLLQTSSGSALKIRSSGSSVTALPDSLVKFEGSAVRIEHGSVKLATSRSMFARAGIVTAAPASNVWTEFELTHVDGTVQIVALKGDLRISDGFQTTTLAQGQQATQKDSDETQSKQDQSGATQPSKEEVEENYRFCFCGQTHCSHHCEHRCEPPRPISPICP
jgi:hypothetical protein